MEISRSGYFSLTIPSNELARGLRPSKRTPRNTKYLVECIGAVGLDKVLQVLDDLENDRIDTSVITDGFPYPQIFVFTNTTIICGETKVYEYVSGALTLKATVDAGTLWSAVDFYDYIYMSNGKVALTRSAEDKTISLTTSLPTATAICNYNGQVFIGSPDEEWS